MKFSSFLFGVFLMAASLLSCSVSHDQSVVFTGWKFHEGDGSGWAAPDFDDSGWADIKVPDNWDNQGYSDLDGYAWYRARVVIPSGLKNKQQVGLALDLGAIDDMDSTFLNGQFIGSRYGWNLNREYFLDYDNPAIRWGKENVLAIKVFDRSGLGGIYSRQPEIRGVDKIEYVSFDKLAHPIKMKSKTLAEKDVVLKISEDMQLSGTLVVALIDNETGETSNEQTEKVVLGKEQPASIHFQAEIPEGKSYGITYKFTDDETGKSIEGHDGIPYILTPPAPQEPRINGAGVYAVRPGSPVIYRMPVTGDRPMKYAVNNLPKGLMFDRENGIISGKISKKGEYVVELKAENAKGSATRELKFVVGKQLALTPPMGWNSWNCWGLNVDEDKVRAAADAFINNGLADYGWTYVNIDDGWEAPERAGNGEIVTNSKFPDFKRLTDYVHSKGLKIGLYSSPGPTTCGGYLGSYQHEQQDAETWAKWGFDYIKYDWCGYSNIKPSPTLDDMKEPYLLMGDILKDMPRDIVYSLCQYGMGEVWKWGGETNGNLWRTTGDITDTWESMSGIGFSQFDKYPYAKPGNWNDPDMLVVGKLGWGNVRANRLTPDEQYTHISLWSLLASPLLIGCDLQQMDDFTKNLLCNSEVIAINQDPLGLQAQRVSNENDLQIFVKKLEDGSLAVGVFNLSDKIVKDFSLNWEVLQIEGRYDVRDVWRQKDLGRYDNQFTMNIPTHGAVLLKISSVSE